MRRVILVLASAIVVLAMPMLAQAQPTKTVSGSIAAIASDSITVTVDGKEMKFTIDAKTQVVAPGAGTKSRAATAEGKGVVVTDVLKVGQAVEVKYHDDMRAANIRTIASVPGPPAPKSQTASGVVSAITGNSLTIKGATGDMTFTVDDKTTVVGTGVGTAGKKLEGEGKKPNLPELLHDGDTVSVTYRDMNGTKHASVVRITKRKA